MYGTGIPGKAWWKCRWKIINIPMPPVIPDDVDCVLVLGGDGTLLQASRDLTEKDLPLLGHQSWERSDILAEVEIDKGIEPARWTAGFLTGEYQIVSRMMISGEESYHREGKESMEDLALNDIVDRAGMAALRIIDFKISCERRIFKPVYSADAMIVISTPTGSTGYSLSAGGTDPSHRMAIHASYDTGLSPHTLNTRSIILPDDDRDHSGNASGTQPKR